MRRATHAVCVSDKNLNAKILTEVPPSDTDFTWKIKFNQKLDPSTVNNETVRVLDSHNNVIPTNITYDSKNHYIQINPTAPYNSKETYFLHLSTNVSSIRGRNLKKEVVVEFRFSKY